MKNLILAGVAVALIAASVPADAQHEANKEQILGTWTVNTLKATSGDQVTYPLGEHPSGFVTMTPEDAEAIAMMKSQVAWTGKYTVGEQTSDGIKIIAHVDTASSQAIVGNDRVYFVRVEGNKVTFRSPGVIVPMTGKTSVVEFEMTRSQ